ncbi:hypothetical protein [Pararhodobacter sp.]|uniref:hypothetical protein n=1 Tax=Pararhodobacter sp. TaxID=2127056 RepID=UPI002AFF9CD9|nr:hypothetical protein [Pararhodobacter sp.]
MASAALSQVPRPVPKSATEAKGTSARTASSSISWLRSGVSKYCIDALTISDGPSIQWLDLPGVAAWGVGGVGAAGGLRRRRNMAGSLAGVGRRVAENVLRENSNSRLRTPPA